MARAVTILGSTGSVGRSTLDLLSRSPDSWRVKALTARTDVATLARQAIEHSAEIAVVADAAAYPALRQALAGTGIEAAAGQEAVVDAAGEEAEWVMAAIVGAAGLAPTLRAVQRGATIALANKECLVCAGELMVAAARSSGSRLLPVDSEHNAIFQIFDFEDPSRVSKVILTASGGPFRESSAERMRLATPEDAVKHPVWSMGAKISIDSATLMNKGLELIEAFHLFPVSVDQLDVLIHPQSIVHSLVEYIDGSVLAQLGTPDMRIPISFTLAYPERMNTPCRRLDLAEVGRLEFGRPDFERFPALKLAWDALRAGSSATAVLNAANEVAVDAFLKRRLGFLEIASVVSETLDAVQEGAATCLDEVSAIDAAARAFAAERVIARH
jgi:1-deoxy-D-xylulose-5-phosphate reductoisomerase